MHTTTRKAAKSDCKSLNGEWKNAKTTWNRVYFLCLPTLETTHMIQPVECYYSWVRFQWIVMLLCLVRFWIVFQLPRWIGDHEVECSSFQIHRSGLATGVCLAISESMIKTLHKAVINFILTAQAFGNYSFACFYQLHRFGNGSR